MKDDIQFQDLPADVHHCTSHREGYVVIWRCPHCDGYERRYNLKTGEMKVNRAGSEAQHTGYSDKAENMEGLTKVQSFN